MVAVARLAPKGFLEDRAKCAPPRSARVRAGAPAPACPDMYSDTGAVASAVLPCAPCLWCGGR
jgi:hypothetical protein